MLYMGVSIVATGVLRYTAYKGIAHPISYAVEHFHGYRWLSITINIGALCGMASVILVALLAQPRIFYTMSVDGLLPPAISRIHPRFKTPHIATIITGTCCVMLAGLLPIDILAELTSVGTLFAFMVVCLAVIALRRKEPDRHREFRVPGGCIIPLLGAGSSLLLICTATRPTIYRLFGWMALGLIFYASYGYHHSRLNNDISPPEQQEEEGVGSRQAEVKDERN